MTAASKAAIDAVKQTGGEVKLLSPAKSEKVASAKKSEDKESEIGEGGNPPKPASV